MSLPAEVKVVEVGGRGNGLQNESEGVPLKTKVALIDRLSATGLSVIEAGSFVSPRVGAADGGQRGSAGLHSLGAGSLLPGAHPQPEGSGAGPAAPGPGMSRCSAPHRSPSAPGTRTARSKRAWSVRRRSPPRRNPSACAYGGYVSCVLGCPYEGEIDSRDVVRVAERLYRMGCHEVSLGDTIGVGTPMAARALVERVAESVPIEAARGPLPRHLRPGAGEHPGVPGAGNLRRRLGGGRSRRLSPTPGAPPGNVATEDVLYMLHGCGDGDGRGPRSPGRSGPLHLAGARPTRRLPRLQRPGRRPLFVARRPWAGMPVVRSNSHNPPGTRPPAGQACPGPAAGAAFRRTTAFATPLPSRPSTGAQHEELVAVELRAGVPDVNLLLALVGQFPGIRFVQVTRPECAQVVLQRPIVVVPPRRGRGAESAPRSRTRTPRPLRGARRWGRIAGYSRCQNAAHSAGGSGFRQHASVSATWPSRRRSLRQSRRPASTPTM